jgi:chromosome segregation ATPase
MESRLGALRNELAQQFEERSRMEQEKEQMQSRIDGLQADLQLAQENRVPVEEMRKLRDELDRVEAENDQLRDQLKEARSVPDLREDFAKVQRERDLLADQRKRLSAQLERTERSLSRERETVRDLTRENESLEEELKEEQTRTGQLGREIRALRAGVEAAKDAGIQPDELIEVRLLLEDMEAENRRLKTVAENQRATVDSLVEELNHEQTERQRSLRELQSMLGDQLRDLAEAETKLQHLDRMENELIEVKLQRERLQSVQLKTRQDMKTLATHIYSLRRQLNEERGAAQDLKRERKRVESLNLTLKDMRGQLETQQREMNILHRESDRSQAQLRSLEEENRRLREQLRQRNP